MTDETIELSILFADISDTTGLGETLGGDAARELVAQCVTLMKEQVKKHQGEIVKSVGDELMCAFPKPDAALRAVMGIRNAVNERLPRMNPKTPANLTIRAGLHHGTATRRGDAVSGEADRMAGLMAGLARAGQILMTACTVDSLSTEARALTRPAGPFSIPGTDDEVEAYEVGRPKGSAQAPPQAPAAKDTAGRGNASAQAAPAAPGAEQAAPAKEGPHLRLRYRGREKRIGARDVPLVMGRGKTVNIVVADSRASREHARIEHREDGFFLVDQSRHGTYLLTEEGPRVLRGEEAPLTGAGKIAFGREPAEATEVIEFACEA